jgi:membrane protein YqaA with SNARE-associated domain
LINDNGPVSPQQISDFDQSRRDLREAITIYNKPLLTIHLFLLASLSFTYYGIQYVITNSIFLYLILPSLLLWLLLDHIPGPYTEALNSIEFSVEYFVWWVGLGILSSIGLGSGLQSGMLFLFPHIIKVSLAAQTCKTLDFESVTDIWFRSPKTLFKCPPLTEHSTPVTLFGIWEKIIFVCFLQSAGTAIGEIPPYWMTRAARLAAIESGADNNKDIHMPEELETNSKFSLVNKAKLWMIWLLKTHGFYGVLLMASYPNIAFDLCGICCGHFLMPFWTFFGATFIGKAIVRNTYQSIIYVVLCRYGIV